MFYSKQEWCSYYKELAIFSVECKSHLVNKCPVFKNIFTWVDYLFRAKIHASLVQQCLIIKDVRSYKLNMICTMDNGVCGIWGDFFFNQLIEPDWLLSNNNGYTALIWICIGRLKFILKLQYTFWAYCVLWVSLDPKQ